MPRTTERRADRASDDRRVASRGRRDPFSTWSGRLPNPDPTLRKFGSWDGIGLYSRMLQQFAFVGGYCAAWIDHVLVTDRAIKPAKSDDPELQKLADAAALRAQKAWARVRNRVIVLQKLLMGRFYGFSRAEKVARFDRVVKEWIYDLYDVPAEAWKFDDDGREFLCTPLNPLGAEVDPGKFIHFQWGSADTKYGAGDLSEVYLVLWYIQKIQEWGLQAVEDWSHLVAIVHMPRGFSKEDRATTKAAVREQYRFFVVVPTDEESVRVEIPTINVTSSGAAGRQEYEVIRFYERWVQIRLLGAPQTQDKSLGTGKLEETRKAVWDDKTPLGSSALDQCLTEQWLDPYCDINLADLPYELRPRFESDATEISSGITGVAASEIRNACLDLAARRITATVAEELIAALGVPRARAKAIADSVVKERASLVTVDTKDGGTPSPIEQQLKEAA